MGAHNLVFVNLVELPNGLLVVLYNVRPLMRSVPESGDGVPESSPFSLALNGR